LVGEGRGVERLKSVGLLGASPIGMDIDRGAIKAVQISTGGGSYTLRHVGYHRLPPGTIVEGEVADHDLLAAEVKEFWSSHSFKGRSVILGIANQKVVVRLLDFPHIEDPEDLRRAIGFEAQEYIPMPLEETVLDHVVLGSQGKGSDQDRILVVAAEKEMVGRFVSALQTGGLRLTGIDVKALSLTRSTLPETFFGDEGAVLLLDVGTELTSLALTQGPNPTLTRFIPMGLDDFVRAVADAADLTEDEAEKQALSSPARLGSAPESVEEGSEASGEHPDGTDPALVYDVRRGLEETTRALAEEVQRSIEYHHSQVGSREVTQVFVSGEGALVPGLDGYLGELLGIATHRGTPAAKLAANHSNISDEQLEAMEPVLAVAFGLAMEDE
jgi:type IV pilus assembly protein PilM